jgi:sugar fermentation stimulation protein A
MKFPALIPGRFVNRDNRFRATVKVDGLEQWAHVPNSGRLTELFTPGRPVWLSRVDGGHRKTRFDLKLVEYDFVLVSVDARLPNPLFAEALADGKLPDFSYPVVEREMTLDESRLDFRLSGPAGVCWVETKSVTLVEQGVARFPDAPTGRGSKHLQTLIKARRSGADAAVVFVVQRPDARQFKPHQQADPIFAKNLRQAAEANVRVLAYNCHVSMNSISLQGRIPVALS